MPTPPLQHGGTPAQATYCVHTWPPRLLHPQLMAQLAGHLRQKSRWARGGGTSSLDSNLRPPLGNHNHGGHGPRETRLSPRIVAGPSRPGQAGQRRALRPTHSQVYASVLDGGRGPRQGTLSPDQATCLTRSKPACATAPAQSCPHALAHTPSSHTWTPRPHLHRQPALP